MSTVIRRSCGSYAGAPFALAALAIACLLGLIVFVALPIEPFGYYKDLGFDHMVTEWAVHDVKSPLDFVDTLAWSPWNGTQLFYLNSYIPILISAPLSLVVGNSWLAIKIVQLLQVLIAAVSAFALYRTARRSLFWACVYALTYAALPTTVLAVRGNASLGWIAALLPASIAIGRLIVLRFGPRALPAAGIVCGLTGYGMALEYLVFVSFPALAIVITSAPLRNGRWPRSYFAFVPLAFACTVAVGAFYVFPTFWHPLFSDAAARTSTLVTGAFLANFSETTTGLLTLVPRESLASPVPQFNASASLPILYAAGTCWWLAAVAFVATTRSRLTFSNTLTVLIVAGCTILALGDQMPGGRAIWQIIYLVPHADAIRTADRFIAIPAVFVTLWAVIALDKSLSSRPLISKIAAWLAVALVTSTVVFDLAEHCFSVEANVGERMPQLNNVRDHVLAIGGRTASFASVNGGSREDAEQYGVPAPIDAAYLDLGSRYFLEGIGASGVLGRAAVQSVITSPNWSYDTPEIPSSTAVYQNIPRITGVFNSPENVRVWRIPARGMIERTRIDCTFGGPGAFDALDADSEFSSESFAEPRAGCDRTGLIDFDPVDDWQHLPTLAHWSGAALVPTADRIHDTDYPFVSNRILLAIPWYRNSIDGSRLDFDTSGAVRIDGATLTLNASTTWPVGSTIAIRLAAPNGGTVGMNLPGGTQQRTLLPDARLRWYRFRVNSAVRRSEAATVTLRTSSEASGISSSFAGIAIDGVVILPASLPTIDYAPAFAVISTDELDTEARIRDTDNLSGMLEKVSSNGMHDEVDGLRAILNVDAPHAVALYRWLGATGTYELQVAADVTAPDAVLTVSSGCCSGRAVSAPAVRKRIVAVMRALLHTGSNVTVQLSSPTFDPGGSVSIAGIDARPIEPIRLDGTASRELVDFTAPLTALAHVRQTSGVLPTLDGVQGAPGADIAFDMITNPHSDEIVANVTHLGDGTGLLSLTCGRATSVSVITPVSGTVSISVGGAARCQGRLEWRSGWFVVTKIALSSTGVQPRLVSGDAWIPAGRFRTSLLARDGTDTAIDVQARGCARDLCAFATNGFRRIALNGSVAGSRLILRRLGDVAQTHDLAVRQTAAIRWSTRLSKTSDVVLAQLFDANWHAEGDGRAFDGERCDITSTCFRGLPAGTYRIYHSWPPALVLGMIVTCAAIFFSAIIMLLPPRRARFSAVSQRK